MLGNLTKHLTPGQVTQIEQLESGCITVTILAPGQEGLRVLEVGCDFVLLEEPRADAVVRIPVHFIRSVADSCSPGSQAA